MQRTNQSRILSQVSQWLPVFLMPLPFLYLVVQVNTYRVDVPFMDQWNFVSILGKFYQGTLSIRDLWLQHNEHRLVFPQIVMLLLAEVSRWNISYELAFSLFLAVGILSILVWQIRNTETRLQVRLRWLLPIVSVMVFSLAQGENWLWGFELQVFMNVLAVVAGLVLLGQPAHCWAFFGAILLGIITTYSFANGVLYWFLGLFTLLLLAIDDRRLRTSRLVLWAATAILTIGSYMYDYHTPGQHPSLLVALQQPLLYLQYLLVYLGIPVTVGSSQCVAYGLACDQVAAVAVAAGVSGLVLFGLIIAWLARRIPPTVLAPHIGIGLYGVLSAFLTGNGRVARPVRSSSAESSRRESAFTETGLKLAPYASVSRFPEIHAQNMGPDYSSRP
ncbi:MAG: hypothetical protein M1132_05105 [Chloroflexi bacterium]|nr:hypothetical protein [Chloroflexota bacterium]